jgi:hypothetical protein
MLSGMVLVVIAPPTTQSPACISQREAYFYVGVKRQVVGYAKSAMRSSLFGG